MLHVTKMANVTLEINMIWNFKIYGIRNLNI